MTSASRSDANSLLVLLVDEQLIRIRPPVVTHSHRLAAPNQLRATGAKVFPAAEGGISRSAIRRAVPAFHWLNTKPVTNLPAVEVQRLSQWTLTALIRSRRRKEWLVPQAGDMGLKILNTAEAANWWIGSFSHLVSDML